MLHRLVTSILLTAFIAIGWSTSAQAQVYPQVAINALGCETVSGAAHYDYTKGEVRSLPGQGAFLICAIPTDALSAANYWELELMYQDPDGTYFLTGIEAALYRRDDYGSANPIRLVNLASYQNNNSGLTHLERRFFHTFDISDGTYFVKVYLQDLSASSNDRVVFRGLRLSYVIN